MVKCEKVLGNLKDSNSPFANYTPDPIDIEWHEAYKKLHRKTTASGEEIGVSLGDDILTKGLREGDVLYAGGGKAIVVHIPPCQVIRIQVAQDHPRSAAKVCYEIGNKHAALFYGNQEGEFITPYNEPTLTLLNKIHGVTATTELASLDFDQAISGVVHSHTH